MVPDIVEVSFIVETTTMRKRNSRCTRRRTTKKTVPPPKTKGKAIVLPKPYEIRQHLKMPNVLAWFCSRSMTANYAGHYTVEATCVIQEHHRALYSLYVVRTTGSGITHIRKIFFFFVRTMSNSGVCQNSLITGLL